jgi:hypothetical protein
VKIDALWLFSDAQAITAAAASTDYKNLEAVRDMGVGNELYVVTVVDVAFTDGSSDSTLTVDLQTDDSTSFGSIRTAQTCFTIPALAAVGDTFVARLAPFTTPEQYLRVYYTPNNGNLTTGSVTTFVTDTAHKYRAYAKNYTISSSNQF